jgi:hypothetical protein
MYLTVMFFASCQKFIQIKTLIRLATENGTSSHEIETERENKLKA